MTAVATTETTIDWEAIRTRQMNDLTFESLPPTVELPALPYAVTRFVDATKDDKVSMKELAQIVETDSGLTLELLRFVNSSFVGLRHKASTVLMALNLLGQRQSKTFLITTGMQAAVRARKSKFINQNCFWNACLQKALFAKQVAQMLKTDEDTAFAAAMLQDFLLPVLTNELYDEYVEFVKNRADHPACITDFERQSFGWDHAIAAATLAHRWHLPDDLVCCILLHHRGLQILADPVLKRTPAAAVAISALLPDQMRQTFNGLEQLIMLEQKWPKFEFGHMVEQVDKMHEESGMGVKNDFPLARRCRPVVDRNQDRSDGMLKPGVA